MRQRRWARRAAGAGVMVLLAAYPVSAWTDRNATQAAPPRVVRVAYGDSVWTLARRYGDPHQDVRALVMRITEANGTLPGSLQPGQKLIIPADCLRGK
jgi:nucleoid-associated protein YgaU